MNTWFWEDFKEKVQGLI